MAEARLCPEGVFCGKLRYFVVEYGLIPRKLDILNVLAEARAHFRLARFGRGPVSDASHGFFQYGLFQRIQSILA